jgi:NAD(P)-dependent dehydrogenase (short-subunit alcohol dehydrogenase family)
LAVGSSYNQPSRRQPNPFNPLLESVTEHSPFVSDGRWSVVDIKEYSMGQLDGKVVIITGAATGIGLGITRAFAREGAQLVLASRNEERLQAAADSVGGMGPKPLVVPTDVTDEGQVTALFARTVEVWGRVDVLINNSGVFDGGPIEEISLATWRHVLDVNVTGPFLCIRAAMPIMKRQGAGRIINIGSISAQMPRMDAAPYATSKHALVGLTKAAALEGRAHGVVVGCLHPGNVRTERRQTDDELPNQEPMMTPDELAAVVVTMAALPSHVNMLESIVLPTTQLYLGRG